MKSADYGVDTVDAGYLSGIPYRVDSGDWWNTSMTCNSTTSLWTLTIPGQSNSTDTVKFVIQAYDGAGNFVTSSLYSYQIKHLITGEVNGDGIVNIKDATIIAINWLKHA